MSNSLAVKSITSPSVPQPKQTAEISTEQNYSMIDGVLNNAPALGKGYGEGEVAPNKH
jgi:hypothetical protein